jgi:ATP-dependent Clp protease ATP-binding subunit ClpC
MGKIYNGINAEVAEVDAPKELDETINLLNNIGAWVCDRDDVKFRDDEIKRIYNILRKHIYKNVLLVGDYGSGKRSVVEGYCKYISDKGDDEAIYKLDFSEILKLATNPNEFDRIVSDLFSIAGDSNAFNMTINIDNIGSLLNSNLYGNAGHSFINKMIKYINEYDDIKILATTTHREMKDIEEFFPSLLDYFTVIKLKDLTVDETSEIIFDLKNVFEKEFRLYLPDGFENTICVNADRYIKDKAMPGKAENLLDEVCSYISNKYEDSEDIKSLIDEINAKKLDLAGIVESNDYNDAISLSEEIVNLEVKLNEAKSTRKKIDVSNSDLLEALGSILGVRMSKLDKDQTAFLKEMPSVIKESVIGQDETVDRVVKNIRRNRLGLRKSNHSAGNFIFIGSTGVGKTHLAKQLAKYLYGSEDEMLRFDMSEYQAEIDAAKLLGSAPGYVGYKESGLLVRGLDKKPESVILFDEIEKAHPRVYDVLLQLLDEGFITGSDGKKRDATKCLIIFTSNIGVRSAKEMSSPVGFTSDINKKKDQKKEEIIRKALNKRFSPEFLNRLDGICYFNSLDKDTLTKILYKELDEMNVNIKSITGKEVRISKNVEDWLLDKVESEDNGARPIIRMLQQEIEEEIANLYVDEDPLVVNDKNIINVDLVDDKIVIV